MSNHRQWNSPTVGVIWKLGFSLSNLIKIVELNCFKRRAYAKHELGSAHYKRDF
jgi:hypothetical protein